MIPQPAGWFRSSIFDLLGARVHRPGQAVFLGAGAAEITAKRTFDPAMDAVRELGVGDDLRLQVQDGEAAGPAADVDDLGLEGANAAGEADDRLLPTIAVARAEKRVGHVDLRI